MSDDRESDLLRQRRANFEELIRLGVDPYPRTFERTDTVHDLVEAHSPKSGEELDQAAITTRTAGRILAIRAFGKELFTATKCARVRLIRDFAHLH